MAQTEVIVKNIILSGQTIYSQNDLLAAADFRTGRALSLAELRGLAARIADHYHANGYVLAQAYLPAQTIKNGEVKISILEGRYGKVVLQNDSRLSSQIAQTMINPLRDGEIINTGPLERRLLLLSEIPGVDVHSTLTPGASVGASDLNVRVSPGHFLSGSVDSDNGGNRYTGAYRIGGTLNVNGLTGYGDILILRALTSGDGLKYGRIAYQSQAGQGKVGLAYTLLDYQLGKEFASLRAHGTAKIASIYASYPFIRSRRTSLYGQIGFDDKRFRDTTDAVFSVTRKKSDVFALSVRGNNVDIFGGGGINNYSVTMTHGNLSLQSPTALAADAISAKTNGNFGKIGFSASRLQNIDEVTTAYVGISGQLAWKNLDISEKIELGGANGVRGYPEGEAYADRGYLVTFELRRQLPTFSVFPGRLQLVGLFDLGAVSFNAKPYAAGPNHKTLSSAGVGLNWAGPSNLALKAYYARRLGSTMATSAPDRLGRFWLQLVKYF